MADEADGAPFAKGGDGSAVPGDGRGGPVPRRVVLVGPPNAGKGTQAVMLAGRLGVPAISTGDMLRRETESGTPLGSRVAGIIAAGELVDDDTMADVVRARLCEEDAVTGFLLDGYPRTVEQAKTLTAILDGCGERLDTVLLLTVPEDELVRRALGRGRADDREDVVRERLRVYREKTEPMIGYHRGLGLLREVDGNRPIDEVGRALLAALEP